MSAIDKHVFLLYCQSNHMKLCVAEKYNFTNMPLNFSEGYFLTVRRHIDLQFRVWQESGNELLRVHKNHKMYREEWRSGTSLPMQEFKSWSVGLACFLAYLNEQNCLIQNQNRKVYFWPIRNQLGSLLFIVKISWLWNRVHNLLLVSF